MIYLDNAATTLQKPPGVAEAMTRALVTLGNSGRGAHEEALSAARTIYGAREKLAGLFGCPRADHVCFTANSTEALNMAIFGLFGPGDHILSTDLEHNSVLRPLYRLREQGAAVDFLPADREGQIHPQDFARLLRTETRGIVCTHASNLTGDALDLEEIGAFCREKGLVFVVDASQTAGVLDIDMTRQKIDVLCFTGHKSLLGPQGTGGLCVREGVKIRPLLTGGTGVQSFLTVQPAAYPTRLEAGTLNGPGIAGLSAALDFLNAEGLAALRGRELALARQFYEGVRRLPGVRVVGDFSRTERAPIVSLNIGELDSGAVSDELSQRWGIATRPGAHCAPRLHRALGTAEQGLVRFSWSWYNTEEETDAAIAAVRTLVEEA